MAKFKDTPRTKTKRKTWNSVLNIFRLLKMHYPSRYLISVVAIRIVNLPKLYRFLAFGNYTFFFLSDLCLFLGVLSDILSYLIRFDRGATWWFSFQYQWIIGLWTVFHIQQHFGLGCLPLLFSNHHDTDVLLWLVGLWSFHSRDWPIVRFSQSAMQIVWSWQKIGNRSITEFFGLR